MKEELVSEKILKGLNERGFVITQDLRGGEKYQSLFMYNGKWDIEIHIWKAIHENAVYVDYGRVGEEEFKTTKVRCILSVLDRIYEKYGGLKA